MRSAFFAGRVMHQRFRPARHRLDYRVFWLLADLSELPELGRRFRFFSVDAFNLLAFHTADYGDRSGSDLRTYVEKHLADAGLASDAWRIELLTMPRILGHVFNPISLFFCRDETDRLRAILYEVSNTFGERHAYLIPVEDDAAMPIRQTCDKAFYVSPFIDMAMRYAFTVHPPEARVGVAIDVADKEGPLLKAVLHGTRLPITDRSILRLCATHPLLTLKIVAAIHWEALFIWLKRIGLRSRPAPPSHPVTIVRSGRDPS